MLFLPASWFHEVRSFNLASSASEHNNNFHIALNYWFHPSDNGDYQKPYQLDFWKEIETERNARNVNSEKNLEMNVDLAMLNGSSKRKRDS
jgi:hypothetical protein